MQDNETNKLANLVKKIKVAMLITIDNDGELRSRPMATTPIYELEEVVYFFTYADTPKTHELQDNHKVNVSYSDYENQIYVSLSGHAVVIRDQKKINELWMPELETWFPKGKTDPLINLLKVEISKAECWDKETNKMIQMVGLVKTMVPNDHYHTELSKK